MFYVKVFDSKDVAITTFYNLEWLEAQKLISSLRACLDKDFSVRLYSANPESMYYVKE